MNSISSASNPNPLARAAGERVEMTGSGCAPLTGCQKLRGCDPQDELQVSVVLKSPQDMQGPAGPFQSMSTAEHAQYEATPAQIGRVADFAKANGLSIASVDPETRTVKLSGSVANYQKAFGVQLHQYKAPQGTTFRSYDGNLSMPRTLANSVEGIFGLSNRPVVSPRHQIMPRTVPSNGYLPTQVASMYNFPKGVDGTGQTIGILEFGGGFNQSDLQTYFNKLGIKQPNVTAASIDGATNTPNTDPDTDAEVALDIEIAGAVAPGANIVVYFAPDTEQGFIDAINTAAHDKTNNPKVLSLSWGSPEDSPNDPPPTGWSDTGRTAINNALKDAANLGVNLFVASGDDGTDDGAGDGKAHVDFPSASPWAISVGGTQLNSDASGNISSEPAWGDGASGGASGGGVSNIFPLPDFQQGAGVPAPVQAAGGRGVPDVAGDAAPETGYDVMWDGNEEPVGGTSCSAPLMAGLAALLGQGVGQPLGYLNPFFYKNPGAFNDVTSGTNGAFKAGPGWDPVTGLGSPDGTKLLAALKAQAPSSS